MSPHPKEGILVCSNCGFEWNEDEILRLPEKQEEDFYSGKGCPDCIEEGEGDWNRSYEDYDERTPYYEDLDDYESQWLDTHVSD